MAAIDGGVPLELIALAGRHPEHCHGLFDVGEQLVPDPDAVRVRDAFAIGVAKRRSAIARLEEVEAELRAAARAAQQAGADVTQLAGLAEVARNTLYSWLREDGTGG